MLVFWLFDVVMIIFPEIVSMVSTFQVLVFPFMDGGFCDALAYNEYVAYGVVLCGLLHRYLPILWLAPADAEDEDVSIGDIVGYIFLFFTVEARLELSLKSFDGECMLWMSVSSCSLSRWSIFRCGGVRPWHNG